MKQIHECPKLKEILSAEGTHMMCGHAFNEIAKLKDGWYAWDDHNGTMIFYCPFCGIKLDDSKDQHET